MLKRALGEDNLETLKALERIGADNFALHNDSEAYQQFWTVYEKRCRLLGKTHPDTVQAAKNFASVCMRIGINFCEGDQPEKGLDYLRYACTLRESAYGTEDTETLTSRYNLAICYANMDRYREALAIQEDVCEKRCRVLGETHEDTLASRHALAADYLGIGEIDKALSIMKELYPVCRRVLGRQHPTTKSVRDNLRNARIYRLFHKK